MTDFQPLIAELLREEVCEARTMTPGERIARALKISDDNLAWSRGAGDPELSRRLARLRALNEVRCYRPCEPTP